MAAFWIEKDDQDHSRDESLLSDDMHNIPKHFDGGDIHTNGQWRGADMCCLSCGQIRPMRTAMTSTYLLASLECDYCGEIFAEYWV